MKLLRFIRNRQIDGMASKSFDKFHERNLVLLFNSGLKFFPVKLRSRWSSLFKVSKIYSYDAIEIWSEEGSFKANGQRLKHYNINESSEKRKNYILSQPLSLSITNDQTYDRK